MASLPYLLEQRFEFITDCYKRQAKLICINLSMLCVPLSMT